MTGTGADDSGNLAVDTKQHETIPAESSLVFFINNFYFIGQLWYKPLGSEIQPEHKAFSMTQQSRRKVVKGIAISLPAVWATPVVESVLAPAHARMSECGELVPFDGGDEHCAVFAICNKDGPDCGVLAECMAEQCIEYFCDGP